MRMHVLWILLLLVSAPQAPAQRMSAGLQEDTAAHASAGALLARDGTVALHAAGSVLSAPLRWGGAGWLEAAGALVLTGSAALLDRDALTLMERSQSPPHERLAHAWAYYGDGALMALLSGGCYAIALAGDLPWLRETSLLTATSLLVAGGLSTVTKVIIGRARPYAGLGNRFFRPFSVKEEFVSFPSGHTVVAFAVTGVVAERLKNPWASAGLYLAAAGVAVSRMYTHDHWLSDVLFGGILSASVARSLVRWYEEGPLPQASSRLRIYPGPARVQLVWTL